LARPSTEGSLFSYRAKVERPTRIFLFGGAGLQTLQTELRSAFALILRVDDVGDPIRLGVVKTGTVPQTSMLGQLEAGESTIVNLDQLVGVFAECPTGHAFVDCAIVQKS
jgi:hypothetical protein